MFDFTYSQLLKHMCFFEEASRHRDEQTICVFVSWGTIEVENLLVCIVKARALEVYPTEFIWWRVRTYINMHTTRYRLVRACVCVRTMIKTNPKRAHSRMLRENICRRISVMHALVRDRPIDQSTNQSIDQSINRSINQPINQKSSDQPINRSIDQSMSD